jgi:hypothetical protein
MTAPATLLPAAALGAAGAAYAFSEHEDAEQGIAIAGGAAAAALGASLLYVERNYYAGIPLLLAGVVTAFLATKRR